MPKASRRTALLAAASAAAVGGVGFIDYVTGPVMLLDSLYLVPVCAGTWWVGRRFGLLSALVAAAATPLVQHVLVFHAQPEAMTLWNFAMRAGVMTSLVVILDGLRKNLAKQAALIEHLERAHQEIHQLKGLIPICAWCHSIRDDAGAWQRLEQYISEHSAAEFTHGICPLCLEKMRDTGRAAH
jgi:hypothetical protein